MNNIERIKIYDETKKISKIKLQNISESIKYKRLNIKLTPKFNKTIINVINEDTINAALKLKQKGLNPLLLNMSDWFIPGGLVELGYGTQEENIFRRSNYFLTLTQKFYPLYNIETIYSPNVAIFRKDEFTGYEFMKRRQNISIIASPAINGPKTDYNITNYTDKHQIKQTKDKIKMMFKIAYQNNHDSLVLSAWGCGAFKNPPQAMAQLFKEVIEEYNGCFKEIVFSILQMNKTSWHPLMTSNQKPNNIEIFKNILSI